MNGEILVRGLVEADAAQLQANCLPLQTVEQVMQTVERDLREAGVGKRVPFVAEVDGVVVGAASLVFEDRPLRTHRAPLDGPVVSSAYPFAAIAGRLMAEVSAAAAILGAQMVETSCRASAPAEQFFRLLGFAEYGRLSRGIVEPWGEREVFDEVFFYRRLG